MALYSPIPRRSTFLFPTCGTDITYIPKTPPAPQKNSFDIRKRRITHMSQRSPPHLRRRLLFSSSDSYCEDSLPKSTMIDVSPTLRRLAIALADDAPGPSRTPIWRDILIELCRNPSIFVSRFLADELFELFRDGNDVDELSAAIAVVEQMYLTSGISTEQVCNPKLVKVIMSSIIRFLNHSIIINRIAHLAIEYNWVTIYSQEIYQIGEAVREAIFPKLNDPTNSPNTWQSLIALIQVCIDAQIRITHGNTSPDSAIDIHQLNKVSQLEPSMSLQDIQAVMNSIEKMATKNEKSTENVLRALSILFKDTSIASSFAMQNCSAIISEVSAYFSHKIQIQHACINILAQLASPRILIHAAHSSEL